MQSPTRSAIARRWFVRQLLGIAALSLLPKGALAHGNLAVGDFYSGLLQPIFHFDSLLPIVAVALWATQLGTAEIWRLPVVFMGAVLAGSVVATLGIQVGAVVWAPRVAMLVLGLLVATRFKVPPLPALALGLVVGLADGYLAVFNERETIERPVLYLLGVSSGVGGHI